MSDSRSAEVGELIRRAESADPTDALLAVAELRAQTRRLEDIATLLAIGRGWSYAEIGRILGMTRQSVRVKHLGRLAGNSAHPSRAHWDKIGAAQREWEQRRRELDKVAERFARRIADEVRPDQPA